MPHKPIPIQNLGLSLPHKICFEDFNYTIHPGQRIGVMGNNGCGKSTLLKILQGLDDPTDGAVLIPDDAVFGYVPQLIEDHETLSGGQRLNAALTQALALEPNILILDEATNHLDAQNRQSLMRLLGSFQGTVIIASHDVDLLRQCVDTLWHIEGGTVHVFRGTYEDYLRKKKMHQGRLEKDLAALKMQKKEAHESLMKEQERASKSKAKGEKKVATNRWMKSTADLKTMKAEKSQGSKLKEIDQRRQGILSDLATLRIPEKIVPTFSLNSARTSARMLVHIDQGNVGYRHDQPILSALYLHVQSQDRVAIRGANASGKSTLMRGILNDPAVLRTGTWTVPKPEDMGYLDQHYKTLCPTKSVYETIAELVPTWSQADIRRHLNDFLFRKNEEVTALVSTLSGGEKVRLSLAQIAAKTPRLLILDEVTNNVDLETRDHIIDVLKAYPGALILISHDETFLEELGVRDFYDV